MSLEKPLTLSTAFVTWNLGQENNRLVVRDTENIKLIALPNSVTEKEAMEIVHFARKFELEAFNVGIDFGKKSYLKVYEPTIQKLKEDVIALEQMNISLAEKLEKFIIGETNGIN